MRTIRAQEIVSTVSRLVREANTRLPDDVLAALRRARGMEESVAGCDVLDRIIENAQIAAAEGLPLCQDCGLAVVFLEVGQDIHISEGGLYAAVDEGVRQGYRDGYLRKSAVRLPFSARTNTGDNTPAIIHADIVPGETLKITVMPKGGGSENMARLAMLPPSAGREGIVSFVARAVDEAGGNPCPPLMLGVGIGGTAEKAALLAKKAVLRPVGEPSPDADTAGLEQELLRRVNGLGIGPMGYGGRITALAVHIESFPSHMGSLPVALNLQCHSLRRKEAVL